MDVPPAMASKHVRLLPLSDDRCASGSCQKSIAVKMLYAGICWQNSAYILLRESKTLRTSSQREPLIGVWRRVNRASCEGKKSTISKLIL